MKILIAEDDLLGSLILRKTLEKLGHEVIAAIDGADAWYHVEQGDVRLVITDWMMPRMDGLEFCRKIRSRSNGPYVYVILVTARQQRKDRSEGLEAGADDFLVKPLDCAELMARVRVATRILTMHGELENRTRALEVAHRELERKNVALAEAAVSDSLTGLKNRRHFHETLDSTYSFATRHGSTLSVVMLDVDQFKSYNDVYGHPAGDAVLTSLAATLRSNARDHDLVARYGGEEFVILLPEAGPDAARAFCNRVRSRIEASPWPLRPITASLGIATMTPLTASPSQLIDEADRALYYSKELGRNRVTHFHELSPATV
jgi:diguanylate cyclase (GGDEF)-like protein